MYINLQYLAVPLILYGLCKIGYAVWIFADCCSSGDQLVQMLGFTLGLEGLLWGLGSFALAWLVWRAFRPDGKGDL